MGRYMEYNECKKRHKDDNPIKVTCYWVFEGFGFPVCPDPEDRDASELRKKEFHQGHFTHVEELRISYKDYEDPAVRSN